MNLIKEKWPILLVILLEIVIGILLLCQPVNFTNIAIIISGILLALRGLLCIGKYMRSELKVASREQNLAKGLMLLAVGLFCALNSRWLLDTFSSLTILYGAAILVMGFYKLQRMVDMLRARHTHALWAAASALMALAVGFVILWNPFGNPAALWIFIGISLLIEALVDLISLFLRSKKAGA